MKVNDTFSGVKVQENGIPQGSVVSPTLFILKINGIINKLPSTHDHHSFLYMDDLMITMRHSDMRTIGFSLQSSVDGLSVWSERNGFKFSSAETSIMHFTDKNGLYLPPTINVNGQNISYSDNINFLGLMGKETVMETAYYRSEVPLPESDEYFEDD